MQSVVQGQRRVGQDCARGVNQVPCGEHNDGQQRGIAAAAHAAGR
jgi:hypothetical protein